MLNKSGKIYDYGANNLDWAMLLKKIDNLFKTFFFQPVSCCIPEITELQPNNADNHLTIL